MTVPVNSRDGGLGPAVLVYSGRVGGRQKPRTSQAPRSLDKDFPHANGNKEKGR